MNVNLVLLLGLSRNCRAGGWGLRYW